jgi:pimeloyl-ACP methyl ester carboxylesterase
VFTDYPGLGTPGPHPYLVGESEGRAVLDSVNATRALLGDAASNTTAIYGHSQGGQAAVWADLLAPTYAPDLRVAGVAAMAPPTDLGPLLTDDDKEVDGIVLTGLAISSWDQYYPDTKMETVVDPIARPFVRDIGTKCISTTDQGLTDLPDVAALEVTFLSQDPTTAPGWSTRLQENVPGDVPATIPLLVAQGLTDTLVRPEVTAAWVQARCAAGANIEYQTYADTGHFQLRTRAAPAVRDWLLARVKGEPVAPGCTDTTGPTGGS